MPAPKPNTRIQVERALQKALLDLLKSPKSPPDFSTGPQPDHAPHPVRGAATGAENAEWPVEFIQTLLSASGEGICLIDANGRILFCNRPFHQALGDTLDALIGRSMHEILCLQRPNGTMAPLELCHLQQGMENGETMRNREAFLARRDGSMLAVNYTAAPITNNGAPVGLILIFHNIASPTRAKEPLAPSPQEAAPLASQKLRNSIERHRVIAEFSRRALSDANMDTLLKHTVDVVSKTLKAPFCAIMEQSPQAPQDGETGGRQGDNALVILAATGFSPDITGRAFSLADDPQAEYALHTCEAVMTPDINREARFAPSALQQEHSLRSGLSVIIHGAEKPFGVLAIHTTEERAFEDDEIQFLQALANIVGIVLDRKHAEQARSESQKKYAAMVREAAVGIGQVSPQGIWQDANRKLGEILGYTLDELKHMDCQQVTYKEDLETDHAMFLKLVAGEFDSYSVEKRYVRKDGSPIWAQLTASSVRDEQGNILYVIGMINDITQRKKTQQELEASRKALEDSNRELDQFTTIASHDLKAPLRKIEIFSSYLATQAGDKLNEEEQDYLRRIQACVQSMHTLVDDLLFLARATKEPTNFSRVDLTNLVNEALATLSTQIEEQKARITLTSLCQTEGDATQLTQLFQNLIQNALKFQPQGGCPEVSIFSQQPEPDYCEISVQDNGIGFPEDQAERLFRPFERLPAGQAYTGTGIGLSICKRIVERHHGSIRVCSQPGAGSTFTIRLPLRQSGAD